MRSKLPFVLLWLLAVAQLAIPISMILRYEKALSEGVILKFRTGIYDPYDPFRGRYVQLNFELSRVDMTSPEHIPFDDALEKTYKRIPAYVRFAPDADGFAKVVAVTRDKPDSSEPWLRVMVFSRAWNNGHMLSIYLPFDKYFMNEKAAPEAERLYIEANRRTHPDGRTRSSEWTNNNYALVRILGGTAAMESLVIMGQPIEVLLENQATFLPDDTAEPVEPPTSSAPPAPAKPEHSSDSM